MSSQVSLEKGGGRRVSTESDTMTSAEDATMWALKMKEGARWPLGAEKGKETNSSLHSQRECGPANPLVLAQLT